MDGAILFPERKASLVGIAQSAPGLVTLILINYLDAYDLFKLGHTNSKIRSVIFSNDKGLFRRELI